jgi:hypothetical protein
MFRFFGLFLSGILFCGFGLALLVVFNWDVVAIGEWAFGLSSSLVGMVADWFIDAPWFQKAVSS